LGTWEGGGKKSSLKKAKDCEATNSFQKQRHLTLLRRKEKRRSSTKEEDDNVARGGERDVGRNGRGTPQGTMVTAVGTRDQSGRELQGKKSLGQRSANVC